MLFHAYQHVSWGGSESTLHSRDCRFQFYYSAHELPHIQNDRITLNTKSIGDHQVSAHYALSRIHRYRTLHDTGLSLLGFVLLHKRVDWFAAHQLGALTCMYVRTLARDRHQGQACMMHPGFCELQCHQVMLRFRALYHLPVVLPVCCVFLLRATDDVGHGLNPFTPVWCVSDVWQSCCQSVCESWVVVVNVQGIGDCFHCKRYGGQERPAPYTLASTLYIK